MGARDEYLAEITGSNKAQAMLTKLRKGVQAANAKNQAAGLTVKSNKSARKEFTAGQKVKVTVPGADPYDGEIVGAGGRSNATKVRITSGPMAGVHDVEDKYITAKAMRFSDRVKALAAGTAVTVTLPDQAAQDAEVVGPGDSEGTTKVKFADGTVTDVADEMVATKSLKQMTFAEKAAYYTRRQKAQRRKDGLALDPTLDEDEEVKDDMLPLEEPTPEEAAPAEPEVPVEVPPAADDPVVAVAQQVADMIPTLANLDPAEQTAEIANVIQQLLDDQPVIEIEEPDGDEMPADMPVDEAPAEEVPVEEMALDGEPPADDEELDENGNPIAPKSWRNMGKSRIAKGQTALIEETLSGQALMIETMQEMQNQIVAINKQMQSLQSPEALKRVADRTKAVEDRINNNMRMVPRSVKNLPETQVDDPEVMRAAAKQAATYDPMWGATVAPVGSIAQGE